MENHEVDNMQCHGWQFSGVDGGNGRFCPRQGPGCLRAAGSRLRRAPAEARGPHGKKGFNA